MRWRLALAGVAGAIVVMPSQASAGTTFGSALNSPPTGGISAATPFTSVTRSVPSADRAPGGAVSPVSGIVTRWRLRTVNGTSATAWIARFRLIRGNGRVARTEPVGMLDQNGVQTFETRLPIQAGDALGLDTEGGEGDIVVGSASGSMEFWTPQLGATESRTPDNSAAFHLAINADVEPDADGDGYGDESQDSCPSDPLIQLGACPDRVAPATMIDKAPGR